MAEKLIVGLALANNLPLFRRGKSAMMNTHELLTTQAKKNIESHPCNGSIAPTYGSRDERSSEVAQKNTHISIRDALEGDREAAREVTLAAYEEYAKSMPPVFWERYRKNIVEALDEKRPAQQHIVAEYVGKIVGIVLLYPPAASAYGAEARGDTAIPEMRLLEVHPEMRGHGIGTALTRECVHHAQLAGTPALGLHTADMTQTTMRMYERMGFVHAPEFDFHPTETTVVKGYRLDLGQGLVM